jgi:hypothetical protein
VTWQYGREPRERFSLEAARIDAEWRATSTTPPLRMTWEFEVDSAGLVWVVPDDNYRGFSSALADSLGSLSPAGEAPALSTYWVDRAITWLDAGGVDDPPVELASGNATVLQREGAIVKAVALYDTFETEELPVDELLHGLLRWRRAILDRIAGAGPDVETNDAGGVVGMRPMPH